MPNYIERETDSLEEAGRITYILGGNCGRLFLQIRRYTGRAEWSQTDHIYLDDLHVCIANALQDPREGDPDGKHFTAAELEAGIRIGGGNGSAPLPGFVAAILVDIGIAECINPQNEAGEGRRRVHKFRFQQMALLPRNGDEAAA